MLYRQMNDVCLVNRDNITEIVKVPSSPFYIRLRLYTNAMDNKYIDIKLEVDFDLDTISNAKPVVRPDDLLLLLV
jgi:hypothetical protein